VLLVRRDLGNGKKKFGSLDPRAINYVQVRKNQKQKAKKEEKKR
jgi:hypothetical protein